MLEREDVLEVVEGPTIKAVPIFSSRRKSLAITIIGNGVFGSKLFSESQLIILINLRGLQ